MSCMRTYEIYKKLNKETNMRITKKDIGRKFSTRREGSIATILRAQDNYFVVSYSDGGTTWNICKDGTLLNIGGIHALNLVTRLPKNFGETCGHGMDTWCDCACDYEDKDEVKVGYYKRVPTGHIYHVYAVMPEPYRTKHDGYAIHALRQDSGHTEWDRSSFSMKFFEENLTYIGTTLTHTVEIGGKTMTLTEEERVDALAQLK